MTHGRNFKRELWIGIMDLLQPSDRSLQEVLREMKDPLTSNGMMPPPLSAIYTPKVGNNFLVINLQFKVGILLNCFLLQFILRHDPTSKSSQKLVLESVTKYFHSLFFGCRL